MIKIYDFSPDDFQQPDNSEFMIIVKTETRELKGYDSFSIDSFQNLVECIRYGINRNRFSKKDYRLIHYKRIVFTKQDFITEYNKHICSLNIKQQKNFNSLNEDDIIECYSLYANWWHTFYRSIFLVARTKSGYLAFDYAFTA